MNAQVILLIVAVILFVISAIWKGNGQVDLTAAGLAFFALSFLVPAL